LNAHPDSHEGEGSLAGRAYDALSRLVLTRKLPAGSSVVEGRLAEQLEISRTPIREAILRLAAEGILIKQGSRSYAVRRVQAVEFFQALKVRELIEGEAVELAIGRVTHDVLRTMRDDVIALGRDEVQHEAHWEMDDRLHLLFPEVLSNGVMVRIVRELRRTTRLFELTSPSGRVARDAAEHLAILDACLEGNPRRARTAMATHLRNVAAEMLDVMSGRDATSSKRRSRS
jgi:DNA-binding GntR family transcriptional regulator